MFKPHEVEAILRNLYQLYMRGDISVSTYKTSKQWYKEQLKKERGY